MVCPFARLYHKCEMKRWAPNYLLHAAEHWAPNYLLHAGEHWAPRQVCHWSLRIGYES